MLHHYYYEQHWEQRGNIPPWIATNWTPAWNSQKLKIFTTGIWNSVSNPVGKFQKRSTISQVCLFNIGLFSCSATVHQQPFPTPLTGWWWGLAQQLHGNVLFTFHFYIHNYCLILKRYDINGSCLSTISCTLVKSPMKPVNAIPISEAKGDVRSVSEGMYRAFKVMAYS